MAKDLFHNAVRQALIEEQWVITADLLTICLNTIEVVAVGQSLVFEKITEFTEDYIVVE